MAKVFVRKAEYDDPGLKGQMNEILGNVLNETALSNRNVIVKPNLLSAASPERAITTHPQIVRHVCEFLLNHGARVTVSDSPGIGTFKRIIKECGLSESLKGLPVVFREFTESREVNVGKPFHKIEIASDALDADLIVNLPKLKTHSQMLLTLGVKNLFGCVVGMKKPQWHFKTGVDRDVFASVLLEIYRALPASVTLLDGILAMEGAGPGTRGTPRHVGVIMGSKDAIALDHVVTEMLGIDPTLSPVTKVAHERGFISAIETDGPVDIIADYAFPELVDLMFGPPYMHKFLRKHLTQRPVEDRDRCKMCKECVIHCPASAIREKDKRLLFEYDICIRCYCCVELCPHGAMRTVRPLLGRLVYRFSK